MLLVLTRVSIALLPIANRSGVRASAGHARHLDAHFVGPAAGTLLSKLETDMLPRIDPCPLDFGMGVCLGRALRLSRLVCWHCPSLNAVLFQRLPFVRTVLSSRVALFLADDARHSAGRGRSQGTH
jgi:hypothetical protein